MAAEASASSLGLELNRISGKPGSPYYKFEIQIHAGGRAITPLQVVRVDIDRVYREAYMDDHSIVVQLGAGTAIHDIGPFQDDLKITVSRFILNGFTDDVNKSPVSVRTYTAYLTDDLPRGPELSSAPQFRDRETANRHKTLTLTFVVEEVAMTQLRKMSIGTIVRATPPAMVMKTFINNALMSIQLGIDEQISGFQMEPPSNKAPRNHIIIKDGTPLIDLPDLLQNEQGGIYSSGLGFYVQGKFVYAWPVYDTSRGDSAARVLQIFLAPSQGTVGVDRTWSDDGRCVSVWSVGTPKLINNSLDSLNNDGNAVRFADASKLIGGMGKTEGNKYTMSRGTNNSEFATTTMGNGANNAKVGANAFTSNPYVEASRMAKRQGAFMTIPWQYSNPDLLVPSMAVEVFYDDGGEIKIMSGTLSGNKSQYTLQGKGTTDRVHAAMTVIEVFLDRDDPDFIDYLEKGGSVSVTPQINNL